LNPTRSIGHLLPALAALSCTPVVPKATQTAVRFCSAKRVFFDVSVFQDRISIGRHSLAKQPNGVTGIVHDTWRLDRSGRVLEGQLDGHDARIEIHHGPDRMALRGHIAAAPLAITSTPELLSINIFGSNFLFKFDKNASRGRERVYFSNNTATQIRVLGAALRDTNNASQYVLLLLATEIFRHRHIVNYRPNDQPGWENAPEEYFQRRQRR
jgi:hypothetical protein